MEIIIANISHMELSRRQRRSKENKNRDQQTMKTMLFDTAYRLPITLVSIHFFFFFCVCELLKQKKKTSFFVLNIN